MDWRVYLTVAQRAMVWSHCAQIWMHCLFMKKRVWISSSRNSGVMHACGHDVHMTCLLGAIRLLELMKSKWGGRVQFIFQPGEERLPGGASLMLAEGIFPQNCLRLSLVSMYSQEWKVGEVGLCPGQVMASCDEFTKHHRKRRTCCDASFGQ